MNEQQLQGEQVQDKNVGNEDTTPQVQEEPKMVSMTQEQLDKMIADRLARQERKLNEAFDKKLNELSEAQKLAQMSDDERKEHDYAKRLSDLEAREKALQEKESAYNKTQYLNEIENQLKSKGLPTDMAELLVSLPAEEVSAKIASMEKSFNTQVNNSIQDKIKSSANTPTVPQEEAKPLTLEDINAMTPTQFKQNKAEIEKVLMEAFKK